MKNITLIFTFLVLAVLSPAEEQRKINVTGKASVKIMANTFVISAKVICLNKESISIAEADVQKTLDGLIKLLVDQPVIITGRSASRKNSRKNGDDEFEGFESIITFTVQAHDINQYRENYKKLLSNNFVGINSVDYQYSKQNEIAESARSMALKAAKGKAEKMAAVLDEKNGNVIVIEELQPNYFSAGNRMTNNAFMDVNENQEAIEGEITINSSVQVTFALQ